MLQDLNNPNNRVIQMILLSLLYRRVPQGLETSEISHGHRDSKNVCRNLIQFTVI